jgi:hypothetical protein
MKKILILIALAGCTPQKRMERIIRKHPELITMSSDTVFTIVNYPIHDTTYSVVNDIDTIYHLTVRGDTIRIINNISTKTIQVRDVIKTDTLMKVVTSTIITNKEKFKFAQYLSFIFIGCLICSVLFFLVSWLFKFKRY